MFSSPTFTLGIALVIAFGLVCFGIRRLIKLFHEEFRRDDRPDEDSYNLDAAHKKR